MDRVPGFGPVGGGSTPPRPIFYPNFYNYLMKLKFVDENMFSAGPDLPGYFYSDELFNIIARKGITPKP